MNWLIIFVILVIAILILTAIFKKRGDYSVGTTVIDGIAEIAECVTDIDFDLDD